MLSVLYVVCALTSLVCAVLLLRGWARSRTLLLLWTGICFLALTLDNVVLVLDLIVFPDVDLRPVRDSAALIGMALLLFGLIRETR